jgi:hypothetical protein
MCSLLRKNIKRAKARKKFLDKKEKNSKREEIEKEHIRNTR